MLMPNCLVLSSEKNIYVPLLGEWDEVCVAQANESCMELLRLKCGIVHPPMKNVFGAPSVAEGYLSMSHGAYLHAAVFHGTRRVGVDVQWMRSFDEAMVAAICSEFQRKRIYASPAPRKSFFYLWTAKEAILKACGEGIQGNLSRMKQVEGWGTLFTYEQSQWRVASWQADFGHVISVCSESFSYMDSNIRV